MPCSNCYFTYRNDDTDIVFCGIKKTPLTDPNGSCLKWFENFQGYIPTEREVMLSTYSDLHKDAYGFRPRDTGTMTTADIKEAINNL